MNFVDFHFVQHVALDLLVRVDDGLQFAHPDFVQVLHFLQFDQVAHCFLEFHLVLLFNGDRVLLVDTEGLLQLLAV